MPLGLASDYGGWFGRNGAKRSFKYTPWGRLRWYEKLYSVKYKTIHDPIHIQLREDAVELSTADGRTLLGWAKKHNRTISTGRFDLRHTIKCQVARGTGS